MNIFKVLYESIALCVKGVFDLVKQASKIFVYVLPAILVFVAFKMAETNPSTKDKIIYILFSFFVITVMNIAKQLTSSSLSIPRPKKRFTRKNGNAIGVEESRVFEMLIYLDELEDWLEEYDVVDKRRAKVSDKLKE